ncbi:MAG TPA: hypothetical protein EYM37_09110 [Methylophaga aminisulfidivorans]|uniref:hypothetical protein n=1 Tax=Methylophaga TaxID=40222 RepID=UPI00177A55AA|nr:MULTISPECIES: hypothetical protein [Methylophaga]HIC46161.1 hypothetical protein [Methylophaga sp.]HIM40081.1 hypothetical protein [Methylophaga aminisulfidivorans]
MSDNYLKLIPAQKDFVPKESTHQDAITFLEELTPDGEEVEVEVYESLTFIDQGQNLEEIICPSCHNSLQQDIYSEEETDCEKVFEKIDEQSEGGELSHGVIEMPCCGNTVNTTDLTFKWPAGFAKFELSALNPELEGLISEGDIEKLSNILGCKLLQVWARY